MEKKQYIQPEIKSLTVEENLMAGSVTGSQTDGKNNVDCNNEATNQDAGAKENTWANTPSVWD